MNSNKVFSCEIPRPTPSTPNKVNGELPVEHVNDPFTHSHPLLRSSVEGFSGSVQAPGVVSKRPPASNIEKFPAQIARTRIV